MSQIQEKKTIAHRNLDDLKRSLPNHSLEKLCKFLQSRREFALEELATANPQNLASQQGAVSELQRLIEILVD